MKNIRLRETVVLIIWRKKNNSRWASNSREEATAGTPTTEGAPTTAATIRTQQVRLLQQNQQQQLGRQFLRREASNNRTPATVGKQATKGTIATLGAPAIRGRDASNNMEARNRSNVSARFAIIVDAMQPLRIPETVEELAIGNAMPTTESVPATVRKPGKAEEPRRNLELTTYSAGVDSTKRGRQQEHQGCQQQHECLQKQGSQQQCMHMGTCNCRYDSYNTYVIFLRIFLSYYAHKHFSICKECIWKQEAEKHSYFCLNSW